MRTTYRSFGGILGLAIAMTACSSSPVLPVKSEAYARLPNHMTYDAELPVVWKAIEASVRGLQIESRDPKEVEPNKWSDVKKRKLATDWIFTQSRDKYQEYKVNDVPQRKLLAAKVKYQIIAERSIAGTEVKVVSEEEIERLRVDGSSAGYDKSDTPDPSRANEMLEKIRVALLSAPSGS